MFCVLLVHRGSGGSAGGLPACVLVSVGGAGSLCPLPANGCMCVCHGHTKEHLAVLQLIRPLQSHIHAAHHCGYVSTRISQSLHVQLTLYLHYTCGE